MHRANVNLSSEYTNFTRFVGGGYYILCRIVTYCLHLALSTSFSSICFVNKFEVASNFLLEYFLRHSDPSLREMGLKCPLVYRGANITTRTLTPQQVVLFTSSVTISRDVQGH